MEYTTSFLLSGFEVSLTLIRMDPIVVGGWKTSMTPSVLQALVMFSLRPHVHGVTNTLISLASAGMEVC